MQNHFLGKTGLMVSHLGFGGWHLLEIQKDLVTHLMDLYINNGGNYVETAAQYGDGESEKKIAYALHGRRDQVILASKCYLRREEEAEKSIRRSLKNLKTDYLDILFLHHVTTQDDVNILLKRPSAIDAALNAKEKGFVRAVGISFHGIPDYTLKILKNNKLDVVMTHFNYYDRFNFPSVFDKLLPFARSRKMGIIGMKAFADGYLYRSVEDALRYALTQDLDVMVVGANSEEMLLKDISIANNFKPMSNKSVEELYLRAPELGTYVCRQCDKCLPCPERIAIPKIFLYEGWYDRQMDDHQPHDPADYALRQRLAFWYGNKKDALKAYKSLKKNFLHCTQCTICEKRCPYKLPIIKKLKLIHFKLGKGEIP